MQRQQLALSCGGLMRCCTASFAQWVEEDPEKQAVPEERIECKYEKKLTMRVSENGTRVEWFEDPTV